MEVSTDPDIDVFGDGSLVQPLSTTVEQVVANAKVDFERSPSSVDHRLGILPKETLEKVKASLVSHPPEGKAVVPDLLFRISMLLDPPAQSGPLLEELAQLDFEAFQARLAQMNQKELVAVSVDGGQLGSDRREWLSIWLAFNKPQLAKTVVAMQPVSTQLA